MKVCIVDTERRRLKRYQIMTNSGTLFQHVYPGKLFSLNEAIKICNKNNYEVAATGSIWECMNKEKEKLI